MSDGSSGAPEWRQQLPRLTDRLPLGRSGLRVSPVCIGTVDDPAIVIDAFRAGVNFFFLTADMHWPMYEGTRLGLAHLLARRPEVRQQLVIAVTSYVAQPEFCRMPFEEVLGVVPGLEHVDVAIIGGAYPHDFFTRLEAYQAQRPGGMRALGTTFHQRRSAVTAINHGLIDVGFVRYNSAHPGAEQDVLPHLVEGRHARMFSFGSSAGFVRHERLLELGVPESRWRPRLVDHYRFVLSSARIDGVLCALGARAHVSELVAALESGPLSDAERSYLMTLSSLDAGRVALDPGAS